MFISELPRLVVYICGRFGIGIVMRLVEETLFFATVIAINQTDTVIIYGVIIYRKPALTVHEVTQRKV